MQINRHSFIARSTISTLVIAGLTATPLVALPHSVEAVTPGYNGRMLLQIVPNSGSNELYTMNKDGSDLQRLTNNAFIDVSGQFSPDGSKLAFQSDRDGNNEIYVMDADGSNPVNLTNDPGFDQSPFWSPDATKIAFTSSRSGNNEIYVMDADGSNLANLTNDLSADLWAGWSPDGGKIAFYTNRDGNQEIYVMDADGSNPTRLTTDPAHDRMPSWSPDGQKIAFVSLRDGNTEIYMMDADGSHQTRLTTDPAVDVHPLWSPDGTTLGFSTTREGDYQAYVMNADGSDQHRVSPDLGGSTGGYVSWQSLVNTAPIATADTLITRYQTAGFIDVLANDSDEEPLNAANLTIASNSSHGTATISGGKIRYAPEDGYLGTDQLNYQICDSFLLDQKCATAVLGITVQAGLTPATPIITKVGTVTVNGATKVYFTGHRPTFQGTAEPGSSIRVQINSDPIILNTIADGSGAWSVTPVQDIPTGEHSVSITATKDGSTSEVLAFTLVIDPNYLIPDTGANAVPLRIGGLVLLGLGTSLSVISRRQVRRHRIPSLFP